MGGSYQVSSEGSKCVTAKILLLGKPSSKDGPSDRGLQNNNLKSKDSDRRNDSLAHNVDPTNKGFNTSSTCLLCGEDGHVQCLRM